MAVLRAVIIDERSAGLTALHIYKGNKLVYSNDYFSRGATSNRHKDVMREHAIMDMQLMESYRDWDSYDENEDIVDYIAQGGFEYIEYTIEHGFVCLDDEYRGQSRPIVDRLIELGLLGGGVA